MTASRSITVTLHWLAGGEGRAATIVCDDAPPRELAPLLAAGCRLPAADGKGAGAGYQLRLGAPGRPALRDDLPIGAQGARDGSQLWLTPAVRVVPAPLARCLLSLPGGAAELCVPPAGLGITRAWLLSALALLAPAAHRDELELLERRASRLRFVSNREHCALRRDPARGWLAQTGRADVATILDGARLRPGLAAPLADGARLVVGDGGPELAVSLLPGGNG